MELDIGELLRPERPLEMVVRGTLIYLAIYTMLRVLARRELGSTGVTNILLLVLLSDAAQSGLSGRYTSVSDGLVLVATLIGWSVLLDVAGYRSRWFGRLVKPPPVTLVQRGRVIRKHLRRELMTEQELRTQLREHGVHRIADVKVAQMEPDGRISVVTNDADQHESGTEGERDR